MSSVDDWSGWRKAAAGLSFLALVVGSQMAAVYLLTGKWGGWQDDPLWVGPVAGGIAVLNAVGTMVAAFLQADAWEEMRRG